MASGKKTAEGFKKFDQQNVAATTQDTTSTGVIWEDGFAQLAGEKGHGDYFVVQQHPNIDYADIHSAATGPCWYTKLTDNQTGHLLYARDVTKTMKISNDQLHIYWAADFDANGKVKGQRVHYGDRYDGPALGEKHSAAELTKGGPQFLHMLDPMPRRLLKRHFISRGKLMASDPVYLDTANNRDITDQDTLARRQHIGPETLQVFQGKLSKAMDEIKVKDDRIAELEQQQAVNSQVLNTPEVATLNEKVKNLTEENSTLKRKTSDLSLSSAKKARFFGGTSSLSAALDSGQSLSDATEKQRRLQIELAESSKNHETELAKITQKHEEDLRMKDAKIAEMKELFRQFETDVSLERVAAIDALAIGRQGYAAAQLLSVVGKSIADNIQSSVSKLALGGQPDFLRVAPGEQMPLGQQAWALTDTLNKTFQWTDKISSENLRHTDRDLLKMPYSNDGEPPANAIHLCQRNLEDLQRLSENGVLHQQDTAYLRQVEQRKAELEATKARQKIVDDKAQAVSTLTTALYELPNNVSAEEFLERKKHEYEQLEHKETDAQLETFADLAENIVAHRDARRHVCAEVGENGQLSALQQREIQRYVTKKPTAQIQEMAEHMAIAEKKRQEYAATWPRYVKQINAHFHFEYINGGCKLPKTTNTFDECLKWMHFLTEELEEQALSPEATFKVIATNEAHGRHTFPDRAYMELEKQKAAIVNEKIKDHIPQKAEESPEAYEDRLAAFRQKLEQKVREIGGHWTSGKVFDAVSDDMLMDRLARKVSKERLVPSSITEAGRRLGARHMVEEAVKESRLGEKQGVTAAEILDDMIKESNERHTRREIITVFGVDEDEPDDTLRELRLTLIEQRMAHHEKRDLAKDKIWSKVRKEIEFAVKETKRLKNPKVKNTNWNNKNFNCPFDLRTYHDGTSPIDDNMSDSEAEAEGQGVGETEGQDNGENGHDQQEGEGAGQADVATVGGGGRRLRRGRGEVQSRLSSTSNGDARQIEDGNGGEDDIMEDATGRESPHSDYVDFEAGL